MVAALVVGGLGVRRLYRRSHNSWAVGAAGEARTAKLLAPLVRRSHAVVLHDRAIPGSRANLDHLAFTAAGALYVDTKNWTSGKSRLTVQGGILRFGRYDQTRALQTVVWEAEQAARALGVPVRPVVAVHGAKVPAPRGRLELGGVTVVEAKRLSGPPPEPSSRIWVGLGSDVGGRATGGADVAPGFLTRKRQQSPAALAGPCVVP
ncbi:nuclease-related domain-containing protein [Streptomyces sp. NPDC051064]|uniref:nuclease-related domain-containing protein n=1 Tax=Streptomyces sp. NPDC051064 TaxID=3365641 RepID=UPI0037932F67